MEASVEPTPSPTSPSNPPPRPGASIEDHEAPAGPVEAAANLGDLLDPHFADTLDPAIARAQAAAKAPAVSDAPGCDAAADADERLADNGRSKPGSADADKKKGKNTKRPRRRKWLRRVSITAAVLLGLVLVLRVAIMFAFPVALRKTAALYGLNCSYERVEFSALGGDAGLWHLTLTPKEGGEPVLQSEYVRGHISTLALLRGRLDVRRVEADGVVLNVDRTADGRVPLIDRFLGNRQAKPAPTPKEAL